jgi:predicted O-methyltransferase YrrM
MPQRIPFIQLGKSVLDVSLPRRISRIPVIGTGFVEAYRGALAARFVGQSVVQSCWRAAIWLAKSREFTNFTYPISQLSRRYIASAVAIALSSEFQEVLDYFDEIERDDTLKSHIRNTARSNIDGRFVDSQVHFGRRIAWYAAVRLMRPNLVVETGVDKGLGSCVLTAALARNASEGHPGYYYGTDINPAAGFLLRGPYAEHGRLLYGDSIESLRGISKPIDLLVNDSDHSPGYEAREYDEVRQKLSARALIIGDNCEITDSLLNFSIQNNREFFFVREESVDHIHPGTGIGLSFRRKSHDPCGG